MNLRPYQTQLITDIRLQYQLGHKSVLAVLPTGGGKTVCFSYIAQQASIKGNRVCVLVHRAELLDQASRSMPVPHGRISAGKSMDLSHTVQVASVQTLARRLHLLPRDFFQLLIVDEAHHTSAGTWAKVIQHFHAAKLLGVTATPIRIRWSRPRRALPIHGARSNRAAAHRARIPCCCQGAGATGF
jgi:DNA repair protein RadD